MTDCLFCKIVQGEIPCEKVYEDENVMAFLDIHPVNPGHILVVPKKHVVDFVSLDDATLASVVSVAKKVGAAVMRGAGAQGVNVMINNGAVAGQVVFHLHVHVVPRFEGDGFKLWPGKEYAAGEAGVMAQKIRVELSV